MTPTAMLEAPQEIMPAVKVKRKLSESVYWNERAKRFGIRYYDVDGTICQRLCPDGWKQKQARDLLAMRKDQVKRALGFGLKSVDDLLSLEDQTRQTGKSVDDLLREAGRRARAEGKSVDDVLNPENGGPTVAAFGTEYLKLQAKTVEPHQASSYAGYFRNHVVPALGKTPLREVTKDMVKRFRANREGEGYAAQTVVHLLNWLYGMFSQAVDEGKVEVNPCIGVKHPKIPKPPPRWLNLQEEEALLGKDGEPGKLKDGGRNLRSAFIVSIETGMREDEQMQMEWFRIDWQVRTYTLPDAKNGEGRVVHLSDLAYDTLKAIKDQQEALNLKTPYVWVNVKTMLPYTDFNEKDWQKALTDAGIRNYRWHDNRHTWATRLRQMGASLDEIMELGGWKSYKMVLRYAHIKPIGTASAVKRLAEWRTTFKALLKKPA